MVGVSGEPTKSFVVTEYVTRHGLDPRLRFHARGLPYRYTAVLTQYRDLEPSLKKEGVPSSPSAETIPSS
jgi:hypothetical protein